MVHVRWEGHSFDFPMQELDIGEQSSDAEVRRAVANRLTNEGYDVPPAKLNNTVVDRNRATGAITVRPSAVFG